MAKKKKPRTGVFQRSPDRAGVSDKVLYRRIMDRLLNKKDQ